MNTFKPGDMVRRIEKQSPCHENCEAFLPFGETREVLRVQLDHKGTPMVWLKHPQYNSGWMDESEFELVDPAVKFTNHQAYIDAMGETIKSYAEAIAGDDLRPTDVETCALCRATGCRNAWGISEDDCKTCPWVAIEGKTCIGRGLPKNYATRIVELQDWIKLYTEDLELLNAQEAEQAKAKVWEPKVGQRVRSGNRTGVVAVVNPQYNPMTGDDCRPSAVNVKGAGGIIYVCMDSGESGAYPGHMWEYIECWEPISEDK